MHCPACLHVLKRFKVGTVTLDGCDGGCGGIWFDDRELAKVRRKISEAADKVAEIKCDPAVRVDDEAIRACPRCEGVTLDKKLHCLGSGVIMDCCPKCKGVWLDQGELEKIQEALHPLSLTRRKIICKSASSTTTISLGMVRQVRIIHLDQQP